MRSHSDPDEWTVFSARNAHNHALGQSVAEAMAGPKIMRHGIPTEFREMGAMMASAGVETARINLVLQINAQKSNIPITWTYNDVRHQFGATTAELERDAFNLIKWLRMRVEDLSLPSTWRTSAGGQFCACAFMFEGALDGYSAMLPSPMIFLDTTHNKNRFGLRVFIISCIGWAGNTEVSTTHFKVSFKIALTAYVLAF